MSEDIENTSPSMRWAVEALRQGTGIMVTDGSYARETHPDISGAGWILFCTKTGHKISGSFWEKSPHAGSYRAERLGTLACHTFASALEEYYGIKGKGLKICCDNKGALEVASTRRRRVRTGSKHADIGRAQRTVTGRLGVRPRYEWVKAHRDDKAKWDELTTEEQLNCICDELAKSAVKRGGKAGEREADKQRLPGEKCAIIVGGVKQVSDASDAIRHELSKAEAEAHYTRQCGWTKSLFHSVDWETRAAALLDKS